MFDRIIVYEGDEAEIRFPKTILNLVEDSLVVVTEMALTVAVRVPVTS
mgnify:CR=1 FL=1